MATQRPMGRGIELKAYAGTDPATGKKQWLYDQVPPGAGKRELDRRIRDLDARAHALAASRRNRRRDPNAPPAVKTPARPKAKTVGEAVEAWWRHHGSKLASAPQVRVLVDGIILPNLGDVLVALVAGTPPDDEEERDPDVVYLAERWDHIRRTGRRVGDKPLEPSTIHRCHGIVGAALRRAGHPVPDPGLPPIGERESTTPLPDEMQAFLPYLATPERIGPYTATRRVRGTDKTVSYTVPARHAEPTAMDLMTEAFSLLVASGPRPVEVAAITRAQLDLEAANLALDARGVVLTKPEGKEQWVIAGGETAKRRRRIITLDPRTIAALRRWVAWQDEYALAVGHRLGGRALVFSLEPEAKEPISPKVFSASFARAVTRARDAGCDLPGGFHLYDMRHYGITQALRGGQGRNVAAVAKRFGTSTRMIEARYEHAIQSDDAAIAATIGAAWGEPGGDATVLPLR